MQPLAFDEAIPVLSVLSGGAQADAPADLALWAKRASQIYRGALRPARALSPQPARSARLSARMSAAGAVLEAKVQRSCGDLRFDRAALEALHKAGLFPALPVRGAGTWPVTFVASPEGGLEEDQSVTRVAPAQPE